MGNAEIVSQSSKEPGLMTFVARIVLDDCRIALQMLEDEGGIEL